MSKKTKKTTAKKQTTSKPMQAEMWSSALDHENEGRWAEAATIWAQLAKAGSKKERSDAAGRAAAATVRAEAKSEPTPAPAPAEPANDATATPAAPTAKPTRTRAATQPPAPRERDPRLPAIGTVIQKRDRAGNVRCECTIEETGIRYKDELYKSLSGAAMAAAKDLGLENKTQNGFAFWGLSKPTRPSKNVLESLANAWTRYIERAGAALKDAKDDESGKVHEAVNGHAKALLEIVGMVV